MACTIAHTQPEPKRIGVTRVMAKKQPTTRNKFGPLDPLFARCSHTFRAEGRITLRDKFYESLGLFLNATRECAQSS